MERKPRKPDQPILNRADTIWFIVAGVAMAAATMAVIAGAENAEGEDLARTMGLTSFSLANLFFSFTARDKLRSVFSLDTFSDRTFLITTAMSVAAIVVATELRVPPAVARHGPADRRAMVDLHRRRPRRSWSCPRCGSSYCDAARTSDAAQRPDAQRGDHRQHRLGQRVVRPVSDAGRWAARTAGAAMPTRASEARRAEAMRSLTELHERGVVTDAEFERLRKRV